MHRFTLRQLEYLVTAIDCRSIAGAAEKLNVSQPTISVAISKLEDQIGTQLLLRHHSQGVTPTGSAENILHSARSLLAHATDLQRQAMAAGTAVAGELRLGSFVTLAPAFLPGLIQALHDRFPDIRLQLSEGTQEFLLDGLYAGRLDQVLMYDLGLPEDIRSVQLTEMSPYVALPASHPLSAHTEIALADLISEPMILLDVPPSREYFLGLFRSQGLTPTIAYSSPSLELVRGLVGRGLGYSLLATRPQGDTTYDGQPLIVRPLVAGAVSSRVVLASLQGLRPTVLMVSLEDVALGFFPQYGGLSQPV
jgi:DNA-binding transcriptional LysR family regulator